MTIGLTNIIFFAGKQIHVSGHLLLFHAVARHESFPKERRPTPRWWSHLCTTQNAMFAYRIRVICPQRRGRYKFPSRRRTTCFATMLFLSHSWRVIFHNILTPRSCHEAAMHWVLHIAKVGYFFSLSLSNIKWPIFKLWPFFYQKFDLLCLSKYILRT